MVDYSLIRCANGHVPPPGRAASRYCTTCGAPMLMSCPNGHLVKPGRFCATCGAALQTAEPPRSATLADQTDNTGSDGQTQFAAAAQDTESTTPLDPVHVRSRRTRPLIAVITLLVLVLAGGVYFGVSKLTGGPSSHSAVGAASPTRPPSSTPAGPQAVQTAPAVTTPPAAPGPAAPSSPPPVPPTSAPPAVPQLAAPPPTPAATAIVSAYFDAINAGDYAQAWALGGDNIEAGSYDAFVAGFAGTAFDNVTIVSAVNDMVTIHLDALQTDGSHRFFAGTYTVRNGVIVQASIHRSTN